MSRHIIDQLIGPRTRSWSRVRVGYCPLHADGHVIAAPLQPRGRAAHFSGFLASAKAPAGPMMVRMTETTVVTTSPARRIVATLAVGGVLGFAGWSFAGPAIIGWWYEPPVKEIYSCASSVQSAVRQFVIAQFVCAALGGIATLLIAHFARRVMGRGKPTIP